MGTNYWKYLTANPRDDAPTIPQYNITSPLNKCLLQHFIQHYDCALSCVDQINNGLKMYSFMTETQYQTARCIVDDN